MKKFFKPEDFDRSTSIELFPDVPGFYEKEKAVYTITLGEAARIANEKLSKLIESWPVVVQLEPRKNHGWYQEREHIRDKYKFKARLALIEEIKKEQCKHEPNQAQPTKFMTRDGWHYQEIKCVHCGVELEAEYKEKK